MIEFQSVKAVDINSQHHKWRYQRKEAEGCQLIRIRVNQQPRAIIINQSHRREINLLVVSGMDGDVLGQALVEYLWHHCSEVEEGTLRSITFDDITPENFRKVMAHLIEIGFEEFMRMSACFSGSHLGTSVVIHRKRPK